MVLAQFFLYFYTLTKSMHYRYLLVSILFSFIGFISVAQTDRPPTPGRGPTPPGLPIDNGIIVLFLLALVYGIYKMYKLSKQTD